MKIISAKIVKYLTTTKKLEIKSFSIIILLSNIR